MEQIINERTLPLLIPILAILVGLVAVIVHYWASHRKNEMDAALKQEMIQRGMSADDIVRVLEAGGAAEDKPKAKVAQETTDFKHS